MRDGGSLKLISTNPVFLRTLKRIDRFAVCDAMVLVLGEAGTD